MKVFLLLGLIYVAFGFNAVSRVTSSSPRCEVLEDGGR